MNKKNIPEYRAWKAMKARCYSPCNALDGNYQKNNIQVCDRWKNDFCAFYEDMGSKPSEFHSLDRIDNNRGYSPENCRWTTQNIQVNNRGDFNILFTYDGQTLTLKMWAKKLNIKYNTLYSRIYRYRLSFEQAINKDAYNRLIQIDGVYKTVTEWCKHFNIKSNKVFCRVYQGDTSEEALLYILNKIPKEQEE